MNDLISYCGINCESCEARLATLANDDVMREEVAEKWRKAFNPSITAAMINCTGCRKEGVKISHWNECQIRLCAVAKGYAHCGLCNEIGTCQNIKFVTDNLPEAVDNLKTLL